MRHWLYLGLCAALVGTARADFEMAIPLTVSLPSLTGPLNLTNRQGTSYTQAGWNNDYFEVVALGFDSTSTFTSPAGLVTLLGGTDIDGATQYRWAVPKLSINLKPPYAPDSSLITNNGGRWASGGLNATSAGTMPFPRYPHAVLRRDPKWALKYPDTSLYAPPLTSADINAASGAVIGQADYYSPAAWTSRDTAPLFVNTATHHPTQLWIGQLNYGPGGTTSNVIDDALVGADYPGTSMRSTGATGLRWAPNSPSGAGVAYPHTLGSAPGGTMWAMSAAFCQEEFGYDLRLIMALGSQECGMGIFYNGSAGNPDWNWAADACADGAGDGRYQMINADKAQSIMAFPDWWPHTNSYLDAPVIPAMGLVSETIAMALDLSSRYYGYFSPSRNLRLDEFAAAATDPWAMTRIVTYGYNQGPHTGGIWALACGQPGRATALTSTNLSNTHGIVGAFGYAPQIVDIQRRIGRSNDVYDWGISWGDVQDFLGDLRVMHFANGIPTNANWTAMTNDLQAAFLKMQGKAPTAGLTATQISFRYNWLTMLRIMKSWLPEPDLYLAKGANNNQIDFLQPYGATAEESGSLCNTQNLAPEIYWVAPKYPNPTLAQAFPAIGGDGSICSNLGLTITADILDDYVEYGGATTGMRVRYALSPGDPSGTGYSLWRDGSDTGAAPLAPVATDWVALPDVGASASPAGGRRYQTFLAPAAIGGAGLRRLYIQADDGASYRTVSWVDLQFEDCSSFTPTPTPCVPDLGLPAPHGPINCFPAASAMSSVVTVASGGTVAWVPGPTSTSDSVGALKYSRTGGSLFFGKLFRLPVPEGSLSGYNQLCIKVWNQTGAASPPLQLVTGSGPTLLSTAPQTVAPSSGYVTVCWTLQNQADPAIATSGVEVFVNTGSNPVTNGDYLFDEITLRTTGGVTETDGRCCPSTPPSPTPTRTPTRTATPTPTRSPSPTSSVTPSPSGTATSTRTLSPSSTVTPTPSATHTPLFTLTVTPSPSASPSATLTGSATASLTRSATPSASPSSSASGTPSASPSSSATLSPTPLASATATPSSSVTVTAPGTFTHSPTFSATPSLTATLSSSATRSSTATSTGSPSATATGSVTPTITASDTITIGPSPTNSPTFSATLSPTATPSATPTFSASATLVSTPTPPDSPTASPSATPYLSPTITPSSSASPTRAPFAPQERLIQVQGIYPNPFSDRVRVFYTLRVDAAVGMDIYNVAGEPIQTLEQAGKAGVNELLWDGSSREGGRCASGVYILHLKAEGVDKTHDGFWETAVIAR